MSKSDHPSPSDPLGNTSPPDKQEATGAGGQAGEPGVSGASSGWRFRSRRDVCRGLETIAQLSLMGGLSPHQVKDLSGILRAIGNLLPQDEAAGGEAVPESLRELVAQNPQLLDSLQHILTEDQLRQLLRQQGHQGPRSDRR